MFVRQWGSDSENPKQQTREKTKAETKKNNKNLTNLISFHELCYLRTYQNASVKCHLVK